MLKHVLCGDQLAGCGHHAHVIVLSRRRWLFERAVFVFLVLELFFRVTAELLAIGPCLVYATMCPVTISVCSVYLSRRSSSGAPLDTDFACSCPRPRLASLVSCMYHRPAVVRNRQTGFSGLWGGERWWMGEGSKGGGEAIGSSGLACFDQGWPAWDSMVWDLDKIG